MKTATTETSLENKLFTYYESHIYCTIFTVPIYRTEPLIYIPPRPPGRNLNGRKRKIIWFNPPFNANVSTNVAKTFLRLIDKHFPRSHKLNKIFNRNTVKVSYSCTENMANIKGQNNKLTNTKVRQQLACN